jgi:virginiamycin B lyase
MNEPQFRRLVRSAIGRPPPAPTPASLHAGLVARADRRRHRVVTAVAFGLAVVVVVVLLGGYRLLSVGQRPTTPVAPPSTAPTAPPSAAPTGSPPNTPSPTAPSTTAGRIANVTTFTLSGAGPIFAAAVGPDGATWYADWGTPRRIGRVAADGTSRAYPLPGDPLAPAERMTAGPDGALWFTRFHAGVIARMSVTGQYSEYPLPDRGAGPQGITVGPDGALWFTELLGNKIGRITTSGQVKEYALPAVPQNACDRLCPGDITVGSDGALWFVDANPLGLDGIGRITTAGSLTFSSLPSGSIPSTIVAGPDGNLWFGESRGPGIGRITTSGKVTEFSVPLGSAGGVTALTVGPDGALWFSLSHGGGGVNQAPPPGQLGRIALDGTVTLYGPEDAPSFGPGVAGPLVLGRDGTLWAFGTGAVTRVTLS